MKLATTVLLLTILLACANSTDRTNANSKSTESKHFEENQMMIDTLTSSFPVQIGNDKGLVKIVGVRTFENQKLSSSNFIISLNEIQDFSISKQIDKGVLIDSNETVHLKDTINADYLDYAIIKNIEFAFVRANTLSFNAILENSTHGKEIGGRFNLFYRTKKKGKVYGWFTDEIKDILYNKK